MRISEEDKENSLRIIAAALNTTREIIAAAFTALASAATDDEFQRIVDEYNSGGNQLLAKVAQLIAAQGNHPAANTQNTGGNQPQAPVNNVPAQPPLYVGKNLVGSVNTRYGVLFAQYQRNFADESGVLRSKQAMVLQKQADRVFTIKERDEALISREYWQKRFDDCSYNCGSKETTLHQQNTRWENARLRLIEIDNEISLLETQITSIFIPRFNAVRDELLKSYSAYEVDAQEAIAMETAASQAHSAQQAAAQNTQNMNNPAYWAQQQQQKAEEAAAVLLENKNKSAFELEKERIKSSQLIASAKLASDKKTRTIAIVGIAFVAFVAIVIIGFKLIRK